MERKREERSEDHGGRSEKERPSVFSRLGNKVGISRNSERFSSSGSIGEESKRSQRPIISVNSLDYP